MLTYVYVVLLGTEEEINQLSQDVSHAYKVIHRGEGEKSYRASDPALQKWVNRTIYWGMIGIYEKAFGEISPEVADYVYRRFRRLGTTLSIENESWPSSRAAFNLWWDDQCACLKFSESFEDLRKDMF